MRSFLLGVLLLPAIALAQPVTVDKPVICDNAQTVIQELQNTHGERPIWFGEQNNNNNNSQFGLLVNLETASWSFIQYSLEQNIACLIDSGVGFYTNTKIFDKKGTRL